MKEGMAWPNNGFKYSFDGLSIGWKKRNYVNPPYGRVLGSWIDHR